MPQRLETLECIRLHIDCRAQVAQKMGQTPNRRRPGATAAEEDRKRDD